MFLGYVVNITLPVGYGAGKSNSHFFWVPLFSGPYSILQLYRDDALDFTVSMCVQIGMGLGTVLYLILPFRTLRASKARDKKALSWVSSTAQPSFIGIILYDSLIIIENR